MDFLSWTMFARLVAYYGGDYLVRMFSRTEHWKEWPVMVWPDKHVDVMPGRQYLNSVQCFSLECIRMPRRGESGVGRG